MSAECATIEPATAVTPHCFLKRLTGVLAFDDQVSTHPPPPAPPSPPLLHSLRHALLHLQHNYSILLACLLSACTFLPPLLSITPI